MLCVYWNNISESSQTHADASGSECTRGGGAAGGARCRTTRALPTAACAGRKRRDNIGGGGDRCLDRSAHFRFDWLGSGPRLSELNVTGSSLEGETGALGPPQPLVCGVRMSPGSDGRHGLDWQCGWSMEPQRRPL